MAGLRDLFGGRHRYIDDVVDKAQVGATPKKKVAKKKVVAKPKRVTR